MATIRIHTSTLVLCALAGSTLAQTFPGPILPGANPVHVVASDLNGDAHADLVVCAYGANAVEIWFGTGNGTFALHQSIATGFASGPTQTALGDLNGDGSTDLIVALVGLPNALFVRGLPGGNFASPTSLPVGDIQRGVALADFDHDGRLDVAFAAGNGSRVLFGNGNGGFTAAVDVGSEYPPLALAAGDVDGDGNADLIGAGTALVVHLGNGARGFSAQLGFDDGAAQFVAPHGLALADLDADGTTDVVTANYFDHALQVMHGQRLLPAGVTAYGTGTGGCAGTLGVAADPSPRPGLGSFAVTCTNTPIAAAGLLLLGFGPLSPGRDLFGFGVLFEIDPGAGPLLVVPMHSDALGAAARRVPLPANLTPGLSVYAQTLWVQPTWAACGSTFLSLVSSRGLEFTIQP